MDSSYCVNMIPPKFAFDLTESLDNAEWLSEETTPSGGATVAGTDKIKQIVSCLLFDGFFKRGIALISSAVPDELRISRTDLVWWQPFGLDRGSSISALPCACHNLCQWRGCLASRELLEESGSICSSWKLQEERQTRTLQGSRGNCVSSSVTLHWEARWIYRHVVIWWFNLSKSRDLLGLQKTIIDVLGRRARRKASCGDQCDNLLNCQSA
jgi:hypothetical protein